MGPWRLHWNLFRPALRADQGDKANPAQIVFLEFFFTRPTNAEQPLLIHFAHRHDQAAADLQLPLQRVGCVLHTSRHQNGIEWRFFWPAGAAVPGLECDVVIIQRTATRASGFRQAGMTFDGKNLVCQPAKTAAA